MLGVEGMGILFGVGSVCVSVVLCRAVNRVVLNLMTSTSDIQP
jgi:hypothetical protein